MLGRVVQWFCGLCPRRTWLSSTSSSWRRLRRFFPSEHRSRHVRRQWWLSLGHLLNEISINYLHNNGLDVSDLTGISALSCGLACACNIADFHHSTVVAFGLGKNTELSPLQDGSTTAITLDVRWPGLEGCWLQWSSWKANGANVCSNNEADRHSEENHVWVRSSWVIVHNHDGLIGENSTCCGENSSSIPDFNSIHLGSNIEFRISMIF